MRMPPPLSDLPRYPIVGGIAALAIGVTIASKSGVDISAFYEDPRVAHGQPWRLVTSILPHVDAFHLIFNIYWLWVFGTFVEERWGHLRTLALVLFLAVGSGAAEYAFLEGGVGLSGVGYGLFGMLWVIGRYSPRDRDLVDRNTAVIFVAWFFLCIVLTVTDLMPIANIAHGVGAVLGAIVGVAVARPRWRIAMSALAGVLLIASVAGATALRPYLNWSSTRGQQEAHLGYEAQTSGLNQQAVMWYRESLRMRQDPSIWYNLGLAYQNLGDAPDALAAYRTAVRLAPSEPSYKAALAALEESAGDAVR